MLEPMTSRPIPIVIQQHAEEAAILRNVRSVLVTAPHVKLHDLRRLDDRIAAHLDGLAVAGEFGSKLCDEALETPGVGEAFAATARAVEGKDTGRLDRLFATAEAVPDAERGLISAFGWVSAQHLTGTVASLLGSSNAFRRRVGFAACAMHGVNPGQALEKAMTDPDPLLRARAFRAAGELGWRDSLPACVAVLKHDHAAVRFWCAWSAVLLGDRTDAVRGLTDETMEPGLCTERATRLNLRAVDLQAAHAVLTGLARDSATNMRALLRGAGTVGDPHYLPWLIKQMEDPEYTRLAGEAFSLITGLDLSFQDLDRQPPEGVELGPSENPEDEDVALDTDESLPWPDPEKIQKWWAANAQHFQPGVRYFMGKPPTREHCIEVLKTGYQRQRIAAAEYLCLLNPGTPLFNTAAPAWRQQRWLAKMA